MNLSYFRIMVTKEKIKDILFYFVMPIVALLICSLCGLAGLIIALLLTLCVQCYTFHQSLSNKKKLENLERRQNGIDDALHVEREEDGTVTSMVIDGGEY